MVVKNHLHSSSDVHKSSVGHSTYPPLIDPATFVHAKLQVPASALLLNHPAPLRFLNHNKLAPSPKPYLGGDHCLVSLEGLGLRQGPYCMACEGIFASNLSNIG
jgi:hypothetical protein